MKILPNNKELIYSGRINWNNPQSPVFVFPCTSVGMRFTGNRLEVTVENRKAYWDNYLGYILDGVQSAIQLPKKGKARLDIPIIPSENNEHELLLFKRQDACHEMAFLGVTLGEGEKLLPMPEKPRRKMEVYGDSVAAGEVSEALDYVGKTDPKHNGEYSNSWYSYAWMTARRLKAELHDIAQGGIALLDKTGWFCKPEAVGMESVWDKTQYNPAFGPVVNWDFSQYTPQVILVAIGQNDSHPDDYMKEDYWGERAMAWRMHYRQFLEKLRRQYPKACIVCCTTLLYHDTTWDQAIGEVVAGLKDEKVTQYLFKRNGRGTPGHLRIPEAEEMAKEMAAYIETLQVEGWD